MDKGVPAADLPRQVSDDSSAIGVLTDSEQWDHLHHHNADGTGWQGRSISNRSIGGGGLGADSGRRTSEAKKGAVIGCGAPRPLPHVLRCSTSRRAAAAAAAAATAAAEGGFSEDENDDNEEIYTDAQLALALYAIYARHRPDLTLTRRTLMQKTAAELMQKTERELAAPTSRLAGA